MNPGRNNLLTTLIDTFFPRRCPGCGVFDVWVCELCIVAACHPQIELWNHGANEIKKFVSLGLYHQPLLENAMDLYKFHRATELATLFATLLSPGISELLNTRNLDVTRDSPIILIPAPLHKHRIRERGFNQNLLLAQKITDELVQLFDRTLVTCRNDLIIRTRHTKHQTTVGAQQRATNLENAFALRPEAKDILPNATVILIDDIVTTGATLNELAHTIAPTKPLTIYAASVLRSTKSAA
jgi:ComF family protein